MTVIGNVPFCLDFIDFFIFRYLRNNVHIDRNRVLSNIDTMKLPYFSLLVPRVCSDSFDGKPFSWICAENFSYQVFALVADEFRDWVLCIQNLLVQLICFGVLKWQESTNHSVYNYSAWPHISCQTIILFASDHFWSCITRASTCCLERFALFVSIT